VLQKEGEEKMKKRQNKNEKRLHGKFLAVPLILLLLFLSVSIGVYAWWDSKRAEKNIEVDVGESVTLNMSDATLDIAEDEFLVPQGALLGPKDKTVINATFNLTIDKLLASDATVNVTLVNPDPELLVVDYTLDPADGKINSTNPVTLTVTIRLVNDAETIDYSAIKNSTKDIQVIVFIE
jgi:flagellar basal body-associated protein FliL